MINTNNLKQNLYSKQNLKFHENGKFKMLMFSDMQESLQYDNRSLKNLDSVGSMSSFWTLFLRIFLLFC